MEFKRQLRYLKEVLIYRNSGKRERSEAIMSNEGKGEEDDESDGKEIGNKMKGKDIKNSGEWDQRPTKQKKEGRLKKVSEDEDDKTKKKEETTQQRIQLAMNGETAAEREMGNTAKNCK